MCFLCGTAFAVLPPFVSRLANSLCDPSSPLALLGSPAPVPGLNRVHHGSTLPRDRFWASPTRANSSLSHSLFLLIWCLCGVIFFSSSGFQCSLSLVGLLPHFSVFSFFPSFNRAVRCSFSFFRLKHAASSQLCTLSFFLCSISSALMIPSLLCEPPLPALPAPCFLLSPLFAFACV